MTDWIDWIEQLKQQQAKDREELDRERLLEQKIERVRLQLWQFIQDTKTFIRDAVKKLWVAFPNDGRYHLHYQAKGEGFSLAGSLPRTMQSTLALDATKTEIRTTVSLGRSSDANVYIDTGLDSNTNLFLEFEGQRIYKPEEFAKALIGYVIGIKQENAS